MFKKLNVSLADVDINLLKGDLVFNTKVFYEFAIADKNYLYDILSTKISFGIEPSYFNITEIIYPGSRPHTDTWPTSINFYLSASDDITTFWKNKNKEEQKGLAAYDLSSLQKINSFVANKNDCYLLDVSTTHSVVLNTIDSKRTMLRVCWHKNSFDEIYNSIIIKE